jgi:hypothetical protein
LDYGVIDELVDHRIDSCLKGASLNIDWKWDQYEELRSTYLKSIAKFVRRNPSVADKQLENTIWTQMPCNEVVEKAKSSAAESH